MVGWRRTADLQCPLCARDLRGGEAGAGQAARLRFGGRLRRLPCDARDPGLAHNSLRAARCARTNAPSQTLKRAARAARALALQAALGHWPSRSQGTNGPQDRLCPDSPSRRLSGASRPALHRLRRSARGVRGRTTPATTSRRAAPGRGDLCGDEERSPGVGARQRASSSCLPHLFERSAPARSELCGTTPGRVPQCSRAEGPTAAA